MSVFTDIKYACNSHSVHVVITVVWWDIILKLNFIVAYHIAYRYRVSGSVPTPLHTLPTRISRSRHDSVT